MSKLPALNISLTMAHIKAPGDMTDVTDPETKTPQSTRQRSHHEFRFTVMVPDPMEEEKSDTEAPSAETLAPQESTHSTWGALSSPETRDRLKTLIQTHPETTFAALEDGSVHSFTFPPKDDAFLVAIRKTEGGKRAEGATNEYRAFVDDVGEFIVYMMERNKIILKDKPWPPLAEQFGVRRMRTTRSRQPTYFFEDIFIEAVNTLEAARLGIGPIVYGFRMFHDKRAPLTRGWSSVYIFQHGEDLFDNLSNTNDISNAMKRKGIPRSTLRDTTKDLWTDLGLQLRDLLWKASRNGFLMGDLRMENMILVKDAINMKMLRFIDFESNLTTTVSKASPTCLYVINGLLVANATLRGDTGHPDQGRILKMMVYLFLAPFMAEILPHFDKELHLVDWNDDICSEIIQYSDALFPRTHSKAERHMNRGGLESQRNAFFERAQFYGKWIRSDSDPQQHGKTLSMSSSPSLPIIIRIVELLREQWSLLEAQFGSLNTEIGQGSIYDNF